MPPQSSLLKFFFLLLPDQNPLLLFRRLFCQVWRKLRLYKAALLQVKSFLNLSLIHIYIPATQLATDNNINGTANIILIGKMIKESGLFSFETIKKALEKCIPPKRSNLLGINLRAIEIGMSVWISSLRLPQAFLWNIVLLSLHKGGKML